MPWLRLPQGRSAQQVSIHPQDFHILCMSSVRCCADVLYVSVVVAAALGGTRRQQSGTSRGMQQSVRLVHYVIMSISRRCYNDGDLAGVSSARN